MTAQSRFMTLADVAEELAVSQSQIYALVKSGDLPAIQVGGRGQWRVERVKLEEFIARMYEQSAGARAKVTPEEVDADLPLVTVETCSGSTEFPNIESLRSTNRV